MSVENTSAATDYNGATGGVPLACQFKADDASQVFLSVLLVGGTEFIPVDLADYAVTPLGDGEFTVTPALTYASGITVRCFRWLDYTQPFDFGENGLLPAERVSAMGDRLCWLVQQIRLELGLDVAAVTLPPGAALVLPTTTFADNAARAAAVPAFLGQWGIQLNNGTAWRGSTIAAGGWTQFTGAASTYTAGNGLTLTVSAFSINTAITADLSTAQALTNKSVNGVTLNAAGSASLFLTQAGTYVAPASSGVQTSDSPTWTGAHIWSKNGAVSQPTLLVTGAPFTGGSGSSTLPLFLMQMTGATGATTWDTAGTIFGINYASGYAGTVIDIRANGSASSLFNLTNAGGFTFNQGGSIQGTINITNTGSGLGFNLRGTLVPAEDGHLRHLDNAGTSGYRAFAAAANTLHILSIDGTGFGKQQSLYQRFGAGSPEAAVTAPVGAFYSRTDGGAGTSFYVKESGTGNTGWVAK